MYVDACRILCTYVRDRSDHQKRPTGPRPTPSTTLTQHTITHTPAPRKPHWNRWPNPITKGFLRKKLFDFGKSCKKSLFSRWIYHIARQRNSSQPNPPSSQQVSENPATLHNTKSTKHPTKIKFPTTPSSRLDSSNTKPKVLYHTRLTWIFTNRF